MKIEVVVPRYIVEEFVSAYTEIKGSKPSSKDIENFFKNDIKRIYEETVDSEGFLDAI